jgi:hypothetical protein
LAINLGWWGFILLLGIYSLATLALARATHLTFFSVVASILVICLAALWFVVAVLTVDAALHGDLFVAPRLPVPHGNRRMERAGGFSLEPTRWVESASKRCAWRFIGGCVDLQPPGDVRF